MTKYEELCRAAAATEPDWPELDEAAYYALPEAPPAGGGYFRRQGDGWLFLCFWQSLGAVDVEHYHTWGTTPERRN
jgi:hypothetical protein